MPVPPTNLPPPPENPTDKQLLLYITEVCSELRLLARKPRFRTVNYLLDMARLEAERMTKDLPD